MKPGDNRSALAAYQDAETNLEALGIQAGDPDYAEYQRVLAYCLMRQGNILRQSGQPEAALVLSEREIAAARACGDEVTLARSLMSNGINQIVAGRVADGMGLLDEARSVFELGDSYDHRQGLGWYWVIQADLINAGLVTGGRPVPLTQPTRPWPSCCPSRTGPALPAHTRRAS